MQADQRYAEKQTRAFIKYRETPVVVERPQTVDDGAGGRLPATPLTLPPQKMRRVPVALNKQVITTEDGRTLRFELYFVAMPDADVQEEDLLRTEDGRQYKVMFISSIPEHRLSVGATEVMG